MIGDDRTSILSEVNPVGDDTVLRPNFWGFDLILLFESDSYFGRFCPFDTGIENEDISHLYTVTLEMEFDLVTRGCG